MLARLKARVGGRKTSVAAHDRDSGSGSDESSDESSDDDDDGAANAAAAKRKEKKTAQQPADDYSDDDGSSDDEGEFLSGRDAAANAVHNAVAVARAAADAAAAAAAAAQDAAIRPSLRPTIELLRADPTLKLGDRGFQQLVRAHPALYAVDKHHRPLPIAVDLTRSGLADCDVLDLASALAAPQGSPGSAAAGRITELWLSNGIGTRGDENNAVGDGGAVALARVLACGSVHGLRTLALVNLTIGCPGARALAAALRHNSALTTLYLGHNCIHDGGAEALAEALRENHGVKTLTLDHNAVTRRGVAQFNLSLQVNRTLTALDLTARRGRGAAPAEAELARLLGLPIDERTAGRARILAELAKVGEHTQAFDEALAGAHPTVRALVPRLRAGAEGHGDPRATKVVLPCQNIAAVVVVGGGGDDGEPPPPGGAGAADAKPPARGAAAGKKAGKAVSGPGGHSASYYNHLRDSDAFCLCSALVTNAHCRVLNLQANGLGDGTAAALAELLRADRCALTSVDLSRNAVTDKGAKALASALRANRTLRVLDLSENLVGDGGADALAQALHEGGGDGGGGSALRTLRLWGNGVSADRGAKPMAYAMAGRALPQLPFVPHPELIPPAMVLKRNAAAVHAHEKVAPVREKPRHCHFAKDVAVQQQADKERHLAYLKRLEAFEAATR